MSSTRDSCVADNDVVNSECRQYLDALFETAPHDSFVEVRCRTVHGMTCTFWPAGELDAVAREVARCASETDVYVGGLPRRTRGGTRDGVIDEGSVLWVDCDSDAAVSALAAFVTQPSMVVASGTACNRHAYWLLRDAVGLDEIERANRQLAAVLCGDARCTDAARILRPPSRNHKHEPPTRVRLLVCDPLRRWYLDDVVDLAPSVVGLAPRAAHARERAGDELLRLDPATYVEALAGIQVGRDRKIACPFHDDRTPSLHVYRDSARGWYCFGCGRGGSVYDFAAQLWGYDTHGDDFLALREHIAATLIANSHGGAQR